MSAQTPAPNHTTLNKNFWQGKLIRLRAIEPEDAETFYSWNFDSEMARAVDFVWPPTSLQSVREWAQKSATQEFKDDIVNFALEDREGNLAGSINSHSTNRRNGTFGYGVAVRDQFRGRGYASKAIILLLRYFFEELRYQKATVDIYGFNLPSIALHEKLGFQREGQLRRMIYTRGKYYDQFFYGMTSEEFAGRYRAPN
jgi:RimJ/RimL family protein N-acetyltransferase